MIANPNDGNSPRVEVATPTIDVSEGGLITATTEQETGYVPGGTKSSTKQLTTQGAKTVTPGTTTQTTVASGRYTTGDVKVAGDANLVAENIAEGVSIFGVTGTHSGTIETITVTLTASYVTIKGVQPDGQLVTRSGAGTITIIKNSLITTHYSNRYLPPYLLPPSARTLIYQGRDEKDRSKGMYVYQALEDLRVEPGGL